MSVGYLPAAEIGAAPAPGPPAERDHLWRREDGHDNSECGAADSGGERNPDRLTQRGHRHQQPLMVTIRSPSVIFLFFSVNMGAAYLDSATRDEMSPQC
jgi:hypothetical protein